MAITVAHLADPRAVGMAALQAAQAEAAKDNRVYSNQNAIQSADFAAQQAARNQQMAQQAYQFDANRQDNYFNNMVDAYGQAQERQNRMRIAQMENEAQQQDALQKQQNWQAVQDLNAQKFQYQKNQDLAKAQAAQQQFGLDSRKQDEQDGRYLEAVQNGIKQRLAAGIKAKDQLDPTGLPILTGWMNEYNGLVDSYSKGEIKPGVFAQKLQAHSAKFDGLGLDMYYKPRPSPQQQFEQSIVTDPATGRRGYLKPNAHGNEFVPFDEEKGKAPSFQPKDFAIAQEQVVQEMASQHMRDNPHLYVDDKGNRIGGMKEAIERVGTPDPAVVANKMIRNWQVMRDAEEKVQQQIQAQEHAKKIAQEQMRGNPQPIQGAGRWMLPNPVGGQAGQMMQMGGGVIGGGSSGPTRGDVAVEKAKSMFPDKASRQKEGAYEKAIESGLISPELDRRGFAVFPTETFLQHVNGHAMSSAGNAPANATQPQGQSPVQTPAGMKIYHYTSPSGHVFDAIIQPNGTAVIGKVSEDGRVDVATTLPAQALAGNLRDSGRVWHDKSQPLPKPKTQADAVKGQTYRIFVDGAPMIVVWDGSHFIPAGK